MLFVVSLEMQSRVAVLCCVAGAVVQAVLVRVRPKTAMQAGCHLLVCETFCWSGLNSFPTKRMKRQRSSSSLAGLGNDLALNGSFGRVRDECRSPEWRAERVAVSVEPVSQSRASRLSRYSTGQTGQLGAASALSGQPHLGVVIPRTRCRIGGLVAQYQESDLV